MIVEHLEALEFAKRRCGLIALFVEIPSITLLLASDSFDPVHHPRSHFALHAGQVGMIGFLGAFVLALLGFFLDKETGSSAVAFCLPIIFCLLISIGY